MVFSKNLEYGQVGESRIANWLKYWGFNILPAYEIELDTGKGPRLFTPEQKLIVPDLFVFRRHPADAYWIEAKHKTVFSWHRISQQWVTGIDIKHYRDYKKVNQMTPWPVWLIFLHEQSRTDKRDEPWPCPVGLYAQTIDFLQQNENHRHQGWGKGGMVYWAENKLWKMADLQDIYRVSREAVAQ